MAGSIVEKPESRSYSREPGRDTVTLRYSVYNTEDEEEVNSLVLTNVPAATAHPVTRRVLVFQSYRADRQEAPIWDIEANYGERQPPEPVNPNETPPGQGPPQGQQSSWDFKTSVSFSTVGETVHLTQNLDRGRPPGQATRRYPGDAPDLKGAINVNGDGSVDGVDVNVEGFEWTETHTFLVALIDEDYLNILKLLTWSVNNAPFRKFDAYEVLFKGVTGNAESGNATCQLNFTFYARINRTNISIGDSALDGFTITEKRGHEYVWFRYREDVTQTHKVAKPVAAYVEELYIPQDWNQLGIGN